jgi:hypothetical protein
MIQRQGRREGYFECQECHGRSFSDATREYHYPECSKYSRWRFGPRLEQSIVAIVKEGICPHGFYDWTECPACSEAADFEGEV